MDATPRNHAPYLYRLAKHLDRKRVCGSWRMLETLKRVGMLDRPILYALGESIKITVPVARTYWDDVDLAEYEREFIGRLAQHIAQLRGPVTLIDGGADFGLFSLKLLSMCSSSIERIIAFEPNRDGYFYLKSNLDNLSLPAEAIPKALADFEGSGRLKMPADDIATLGDSTLDHASQFLEASPDGPISVTTIDSIDISPSQNVVIKLDLEGGELAALRGAPRTLQSASRIIVTVEAHPLVTQRTGIDPVEYLRLLSTWRPFAFVVGETGVSVNTERPVFDQVPREIANIIAVGTPLKGTATE